VFSIQSVDSLNSRFKPLEGPHTDAIFAVDDDMRVPCSDLDVGFEVWRNSPRNIVGFMPRLHLRGKTGFVYACWWRVWWHGVYSIILTKAAFLHHDYFHAYTHKMPQAIRDLVDRQRNCEDIAMQFLISNLTSLAPIYVKGHLEVRVVRSQCPIRMHKSGNLTAFYSDIVFCSSQDLGALNGISTKTGFAKSGHMDQRSNCLNSIAEIYGWLPLVTSHFLVDSTNNGWTNSPSTWYEYISSDLWLSGTGKII
jgi:Glycosyl transferase family 64 domain